MSINSGILVLFQIITMLYLVISNYPVVKGFGLILQIIAVLLGLWGVLSMKIGNFNIQPEVKSKTLIQSGPYNWIRNPMYTAVILFYLPIVIQNFSWINAIVFIALVVILLMKIFSEEEFLEERFGKDYMRYKKRSKRLMPFVY